MLGSAEAVDSPTLLAPDPKRTPARSVAPTAPVAPLDLGPAVMRSAIAEADRDWSPTRGGPTAFGNVAIRRQARIDRRFDDATIESCGGGGALKFDPPTVGPVGLGGLLALPFLVHAMATGRCKMNLQSPFVERPSGR